MASEFVLIIAQYFSFHQGAQEHLSISDPTKVRDGRDFTTTFSDLEWYPNLS